MSKATLSTIKRPLALLVLSGLTLGLFGCDYANYADYQAMYTAGGKALIKGVSDSLFTLGKDWNAIVRDPTTAFAQGVWANWVDNRIPDDLPNNPIVKR